MKYIAIAVTLLLIIGGVFISGMQPATAQNQAESIATLLEQLSDDGTLATVDFMQTVPRLGKSVDIGIGNVTVQQIGTDMVCFAQQSQNVKQVTCVPYTNISAIFFAE